MKKIVLALILSLSSFFIYGQSTSTYGKEFSLMFFPNYSFGSQLSIDISSRSLSTVLIHTATKDTTVLVLPDLISTIILPSSSFVPSYEAFTVSKNLVTIKSDNLISVFATNSAMRSTDATMVLPTQLLGTEYIVQTYNEMEQTYNGFAGIVATADKTEIEITPSEDFYGDMGYYPANEPYYISLNKGECYLISSFDPTGTRIRSTSPCKKIAVFGASQCTYVRAQFCDHLYEQLWPLNFWGRTFLTVPLKTRFNGDSYRIIAKNPGTVVKINKNFKQIELGALEYSDQLFIQPTVIESNYPISVMQLSNGGAYDNIGEMADPFMVSLLPVEQAIDYITFSTTNGRAEDSVMHYINVTCKTKDINSVVMDTNLLYNNFKPYKSALEYSYASVDVKNILPFLSTHVIASTGGINAVVYGYGFHYSYGYTVGGIAFNSAFDFTYDEVSCTEKEIAFNALDGDLLFGKKYFWNFGDGSTSTIKNPKHAFAQSGNYTVKLVISSTDNCYKDSITRDIQVKLRELSKPTITISKDQKICKGGSVQLNASGGKKYSWLPVAGLSDPNIPNPIASPSKKTKYTVTVSSDSLCAFDTASVTVSFVPLPVAKAIYEIEGYNVQFRSTTEDNVNFWTWNFGDNSPLSYDMEPKHTYSAKGIYTVNLEVSRECGDKNFVRFDININGGKDKDSVKNDDTDPNFVFTKNSENPKFEIFPNPIQNEFTIESDLKIASVKLFSIDGRELQHWEGNMEKYKLNAELAKGIYFVKVGFKDTWQNSTLKVLKN